jgi:hypothetical protein
MFGGSFVRRLRVFLFIVGVLLLVAGVYLQDGVARGGLIALNVVSMSKGAPSWDDLNHGYEFSRPWAQTGLILKLIGLAILFSLFFLTLHREGGRKNGNTFLPTLLGLGSGICFAIFSVLAPLAKSVWWTIKPFAARLPSGLDTRGLSELQNARFAEGINSVTGAVVLAIGLFLLVAALVTYRHGTGKSILISSTAPSLFIFLAQGREMIEVSRGVRAGVFFYIAIIFAIVAIAIFIRGLLVRKKAPGKMSLLTVALLVMTGCLALAFWITSLVEISAIHSSELHAVCQPVPPDIVNYYYPLVVSASLFYICLMLCAVFLPIMCAFSLRQTAEASGKTGGIRRSSLPLIALGVSIAAFLVAGFFGLGENPYKASLRKVSLPYGLSGGSSDKEWVKDDVARIESEEGLRFLREMVNDPREFYWHQYIVNYLWNWSQNPKAKEIVFDILDDTDHPIAAANAYSVIRDDVGLEALEAILSHLSREPGDGGKLFGIALENRQVRGGFVLDIMKRCADASVEKFSFRKRESLEWFREEMLDLPEGFTVYYRRTPEPGLNKFIVKLLWCNRTDWEPSADLWEGRAVLEAEGERFGYTKPGYGGEWITDYEQFSKALRARINTLRGPSGLPALWVELQFDALMPSYHIRQVLNACAKAGVTEVSVTEP